MSLLAHLIWMVGGLKLLVDMTNLLVNGNPLLK